jgi:hypothetical protein
MAESDRVDAYIERMGLVCLVSDADWLAVIERVKSVYGVELYHRTERILQQPDPFRCFSTSFPDGLVQPYRHTKYLELQVIETPVLDDLTDWLHSRGIPTQYVIEPPDESGTLRIFGYVDPAS